MVSNAAIAAAVDDGTSAGAAADPAATLAARVAGPPSDISAPWPSAPWAPRQIYYPKWMFGEWRVDSTYTSFAAPLGERFVAGPLLQAARVPAAQGGPGSTVTYSQRFFSTLPDTLSNQFRVNVGWMPEDAIIPDRAYNSRVMTNAFLGYEAVASVAYDPRDAPDRETVEFARQTPDGRTLPPKKTELYISNMRSAEGVLPSGQSYFVACECYRQVLLGVRQVDVTDYEVMNLFKLERDGQVVGTQRTAIYLEPRDANYFNARGRAVAVYDYKLQMTREAAPADAVGAVACVTTPKDFIQCI